MLSSLKNIIVGFRLGCFFWSGRGRLPRRIRRPELGPGKVQVTYFSYFSLWGKTIFFCFCASQWDGGRRRRGRDVFRLCFPRPRRGRRGGGPAGSGEAVKKKGGKVSSRTYVVHSFAITLLCPSLLTNVGMAFLAHQSRKSVVMTSPQSNCAAAGKKSSDNEHWRWQKRVVGQTPPQIMRYDLLFRVGT